MPNTNAPFGFRPVDPNTRLNAYTIASAYGTAINIGDPVKFTGTGTGALAGIQVAVGGDTVVGVLAGVDYTDSTGRPRYGLAWPASTVATNIIAYVYDDPNAEFVIQCDGAFAVTDYANKADFLAGTGTLSMSGYVLPSTNIGTGDNLRIRRLFNSPYNEVGTYAQVVVAFAEHSYAYPFTAV
jgi:hypothetical protein